MSLVAELGAALSSAPTRPLLAGDLPGAGGGCPVPAAVLVAVTDRAQPGVILTVRRDDLRTHAGQVAFPGGRIDPGEGPREAARREAFEELDIDPQAIAVVGELQPYLTVTGFAVTPVVGVIPPDLPLVPHAREVADWFEAPLDHLLDPANHRRQSVELQGKTRHYYEIAWDCRRIWGATAAMLVNLSRLLGRS